MNKEFYDKYSKDLECSCCQDLEHCINGKEPLKINCAIHYFKDKIANLETKLAESEKKVDEFHDKLLDEIQNKVDREVELTNCLNNVVDERDQLKQQLAEKEQLIEFYIKSGKEQCDEINKINHNALIKAEEIDRLTQSQNQTAIAELEKVKRVIDASVRDDHIIWDFDIKAHIDQQIKSLKGEK